MSKKNFLIITSLIILLLLNSCSSKFNMKVVNIHAVSTYTPDYITYYLPKAKLSIELQLTKITEQQGPYAQYATEFFGDLNNIITKNITYWQITDIQINTIPIRDTNNLWIISGSLPCIYNIHLTPEGFLASINTYSLREDKDVFEEEKFIQQTKYKSITQNFSTIDRGYKEVYDTIFRVQELDTTERIIPIIKKRLIKKSTYEEAKEVADEIFALRDDRIALLLGEGDNDNLPDGQALKLMIEGIDKLEKQYMSLFIGRVDKTTYHYKYQTIPEIKNYITKSIIFRFSHKYGLLPNTDMRGKPVYLEIETLGTTHPLHEFNANQDLLRRIEKFPNNEGLAYRIPELAIIRVKLDNRLLAQKKVLLPQAGTIQRLPIKIFSQKDVQILFDPHTGAIRSIQTNK